MATAQRTRIPPFLMAIMVAHGAIAGALSPFSPTGVIASKILRKWLSVAGIEGELYVHNLMANVVVAFGGYFLFGDWELFRLRYISVGGCDSFGKADSDDQPEPDGVSAGSLNNPQPLERAHWWKLGLIVLLLISVLGFKVDVGMAAFTGAVLMAVFRLSDENRGVVKMPWGVLLYLCVA